MKIAICISGSIRKLQKSVESVNKLKEKYDCSVFIHTWYNIEDVHKNDDDIIENLSKYNPVACLIEDYKVKEKYINKIYMDANFKQHVNINDSRTISMYYSLYKSNQLKKDFEKENSMEFDCVIRMRFDSKINSDFILEEYDISNINIPLGIQSGPQGKDFGGYNDQFALGSSKKMDTYCDVINNISNISDTYHPETILKNHLDYNKINPHRIQLDVRVRSEY
jgi:hypothetical protein